MPHGPEDFEEAWAEIVADLTSGPQPVGGLHGTGPDLLDRGQRDASQAPPPSGEIPDDTAAEPGPRTPPASGGVQTSSDPPAPGPAGPGVAAPGSPGTGSPGDHPAGPPRDPAPDAGLRALFEPLNVPAASADAGSSRDTWDDEGHFTPPPPPELPEGTPLSRLAWAGTLGGPAVLALIALTGWDAPRVVALGAGLVTLAGFVTLVWQMPEGRDDGWDDGARL